MSDYEKINARVQEQIRFRRKSAFVRIVIVLAYLLAAFGVLIGLKAIGFISLAFMVILASVSVCISAFKIGYICRDIKF